MSFEARITPSPTPGSYYTVARHTNMPATLLRSSNVVYIIIQPLLALTAKTHFHISYICVYDLLAVSYNFGL